MFEQYNERPNQSNNREDNTQTQPVGLTSKKQSRVRIPNFQTPSCKTKAMISEHLKTDDSNTKIKILVSLKKDENCIGLRKGRLAPNFHISTIDGVEVSLGNLREKNVILFFFPYCFEEISTRELLDISAIRQSNYTILCISQDSPYAMREFRSNYFQGVDLSQLFFISDISTEVRKLYAIKSNSDWEKAIRANYLIDRDGIIADFQFGDITQQRNISNLMSFYESLMSASFPNNDNKNL